MKHLIFSCILILSIVLTQLLDGQTVKKNQSKKRDYVPNKETAIKIAEAIWLPIYGEKIYEDTPFVAMLRDSSIWIVRGTLNPAFRNGGVAYIEIQKNDCKILKVKHGK